MRMTFDLDPCLTLEVAGNVPRHEHDPATVCLNLLRTPLPVPVTSIVTETTSPLPPGYVVVGPPGPGPFGFSIMDYVQPPIETVVSVTLKPSHARAIASAILSAATEAKR